MDFNHLIVNILSQKIKKQMKNIIKILFLVFLELTLTYSNFVVSDTDSGKDPNCKKADYKNKCIQCDQGYNLVMGQCFQLDREQNQFAQYMKAEYLPCNGNDSCGEIRKFTDEKQYRKFISNKRRYTIGILTFKRRNRQSDEAQILKTDGDYIYTASKSNFVILKADPNIGQSLITKIKLDFAPQGFILDEDYVAIFGSVNTAQNPRTRIRIFNIQNKKEPRLTKSYFIQGLYVDARMTISGFVCLVTNQQMRKDFQPWNDLGEGRVYVSYSELLYYPQLIRPLFVNIVSFSLQSGQISLKGLFVQQMIYTYISPRAVYISSAQVEDKRDSYSKIKKIFVHGKNIIPFADGVVRGQFLFSDNFINEFGAFVRVLSITSEGSGLYILDYNLKPYGELTGIKDRVPSPIFYGYRLYLAFQNLSWTKKQPMQLILVNLQSHKFPKLEGTVNISIKDGFLQPYDNNTIIGVGYNNFDQIGKPTGPIKISIIDIKDISRPLQLTSINLNLQPSVSLYQNNAFLFEPSLNLLVIPARIQPTMNGAFAFGIQDKREISRMMTINFKQEDDGEGFDFDSEKAEQSSYIGNYLYTKSTCFITINALDSFTKVKSIKVC